jgi:g-D-glutamyl-meso-diaminopimelate peptidase
MFLSYIEKNGNVELYKIGKSILSEDITVYKLGTGKRHILYVGAHHGAEYITQSVLYEFILHLMNNSERPGVYRGIDIDFLLKTFSFWIIPCVNPDGCDMNVIGAVSNPLYERQKRMNGSVDFTGWQANARGVDLNHNYDYGFYEYKRLEALEGIVAGRTRYSGEYPESEPESKAVASFVRALMPSLVISLHTQGEEIFASPDICKVKRILYTLEAKTGYKASTPSGLSAYGGLCDYTGNVLGIPSFTIELGKGINPLPYSQIKQIFERILPVLYSVATFL